MIKIQNFSRRGATIIFLLLLSGAGSSLKCSGIEKETKPLLHYSVSMADPSTHYFHVELICNGWNEDTLDFKMPRWTPGYYQIMDYAREVENISARDRDNKPVAVNKLSGNSWQIKINKGTPFSISYDIKASRKFVANNYLDTTHAYIVPAATFLYINGYTTTPVSVKVNINKRWNKIATGLDPVTGSTDEYYSPDFDILYDCPILIGNLEELPHFYVNGIEHRFIGYELGNFDKAKFMSDLKAAVQAGVDITGDVPYRQYTFLAIGPGFGGIEHLNNTTVSFNGNGLDRPEGMNRMMNFLAHEYFHNYNVKRIRPYELGPFDYDRENKTNLLWESEGLTVYYEYLIVKRAGLMNEQAFLKNFEGSINAFENSPGRFYQSLTQASFMTWSEGPFGRQGEDADKSISYYDKGPVVGLVLDFAIRNATMNKKSLDDVMRFLYWKYYIKLQRGFTDAEFQQACEDIAGKALTQEFEYVNTTREIDYAKYLSYAGLKADETINKDNGKRKIVISRLDNITPQQSEILKSWLGE
jgi:predicted metalloprotease with PDZ domain